MNLLLITKSILLIINIIVIGLSCLYIIIAQRTESQITIEPLKNGSRNSTVFTVLYLSLELYVFAH